MKNFKKIISLTISLVLLSVYIPTYSFADKAPSGDSLLNALGISCEADGEYLTRAEAAYYALKISGYSDIPKAAAYTFSDVDSADKNADAVMYARELGVISDSDMFYPKREVTAAEFFKMTDTALGYSDICERLGGWKSGYMSFSESVGMLRSTSLNADSKISLGQLHDILSDILMSDYVDKYVSDKIELTGDYNVLYKVFGIYRVSGRMTANAVTSLNSDEGAGENRVKIENDTYLVDEELYPSIIGKIGYELNLWAKEDKGGADEIIAFEEKSSNRVTKIYSDDFDGFSRGKIEYSENGKSREISVSPSASIIYNGKAIESSLPSDIFDGKWGTVCTVSSGGAAAHTVIIYAYENYFVGKKDDETFSVYDNTSDNRKISFEDGDGEISEFAYFRTNTGQKLEFSDIALNSVLSVAKSGNFYDVIVTSETVSGTVEAIENMSDGKTEIIVDSDRYELSEEMSSARIAKIALGNTYTFYLDARGAIAAGALSASLGKEMNWVYLIDVKKSDDDDTDHLSFKVLTASGDVVRLKNAKRLKIDGSFINNSFKSLDSIRDMFLYVDSGGVKHDFVESRIVRLSVNDNAEVSSIDTAILGSDENKTDSLNVLGDDTVKRIFKSGEKTFGTDFALSSDAVIFSVPQGKATAEDKGDNSLYGVSRSSIWTNDNEYYVSAYNTDFYSRLAGAVVTTESGMAASSQDYITVITDISWTVDSDGETTIKLSGLQNNSEMSWLLSGSEVADIDQTTYETAADNSGTHLTLQKGDAIRFSLDKDGKISNIQLVFDCSARKFNKPSGVSEIDTYAREQISIGKAYRLSGNYLTTIVSGKQVFNSVKNARVYEVSVGKSASSVRKSSLSAIKDEYNYDEETASFMVIQNRYNDCRTIVIYNY